MGTATTTSRSMASIYRINCVIRKVSGRKRSRRTPLPKPLMPSSHLSGCRSCVSYGNGFNIGRSNFWKEGRANCNISGTKGNGKSLHCFALNVSMNHKDSGDQSGATFANWINDDGVLRVTLLRRTIAVIPNIFKGTYFETINHVT